MMNKNRMNLKSLPGNILLVLLLFSSVIVFGPARAELRVDITSGQIEALPIALPDFFGGKTHAQTLGRDIAAVLSEDLERSGLFRPIDRRAFIQARNSLRIRPNFPSWRQINAQALVVGSTEIMSNGQLRVDFRLWDVFAGQQLVGLRTDTEPSNW